LLAKYRVPDVGLFIQSVAQLPGEYGIPIVRNSVVIVTFYSDNEVVPTHG